jgi:hypothetical protein
MTSPVVAPVNKPVKRHTEGGEGALCDAYFLDARRILINPNIGGGHRLL